MAKDADEIRHQIEETRARLSDTVDAIGYDAGIPQRVKDAVADKVDAMRDAVTDGVDAAKSAAVDAVDAVKARAADVSARVADVSARISDAMPTATDVRVGATRFRSMIRDNPIGAAIGSVALGFLVGLLLPRTSIESERMRDVRRMAKDARTQVVEAGRQIVLDTVSITLGSARRPDSM